MATIDEFITTYFSELTVETGPTGFNTVLKQTIPPALSTDDTNITKFIERSTKDGQRDVIPIVSTPATDKPAIIESTEVPRTEEFIRERALDANLQVSVSTLNPTTRIDQTKIDARDEAVIPEVVRPEPKRDAAAVNITEQPAPDEDIIRPVTVDAIQLNAPIDNRVVRLQAQAQEVEESTQTTELSDALQEEVSQEVSQEAVLLTQQFVAGFVQDGEERATSIRNDLQADREVTTFAFDPNNALFVAPDIQFDNFQEASAAVAASSEAYSDSVSDSFSGGFDFGGGGG